MINEYEKALGSWKDLNEALKTLTEEKTLELLTLEQQGKARASFLTRIHARYNVLRGERERKELHNG